MKVLDMDKKLDDNIEKVVEMDGKLEDNIEKTNEIDDKVNNIDERVIELENAAPQIESQNQVHEEEWTERENRRPNILVHNLPEPAAAVRSFRDRKEQDMLKLKEMLSSIGVDIDVQEDIKFSRRTGEAAQDSLVNPRPLLVGFREQATRDKVLSKVRKLADTPHKDVNIVADLTARQRQYESDLRRKAEELNGQLSQEDSLNFKWQVLGPRGQRILKKTTVRQDHPTTRAGGEARRGTEVVRDRTEAARPRDKPDLRRGRTRREHKGTRTGPNAHQ